MLIITLLPFSLFDLIFPLFIVIVICRYSRTEILCNNLSEGLKMLAIRQLLSLLMLHGLVTGKLMLGTGLHLEYIQCSLSRSSVSEQYILYSELCIALCVIDSHCLKMWY